MGCITFIVTDEELEALVEYHMNKEYHYADKREYCDADYHKKRKGEVLERLTAWRAPKQSDREGGI
jgi:hypothetical protein